MSEDETRFTGDTDNGLPLTLKPHQHLSDSLKARLKRSRRSLAATPSSVAKRLCVDDEDDKGQKSDGQQVPADRGDVANEPSGDGGNVHCNEGHASEPLVVDVGTLRDVLRGELRGKMEVVRRLNMVKVYRSKNNFTHLQALIAKWRGCSQSALYELQSDVPVEGRKAGLADLMDLFGLEDKILHFDRLEDDFTD
ncbi:hypothetical protein NHX12_021979 [Muraenolepis orangiensis]|uniref:Swi5-dependent recombination DNA repair protein 1 homolog n=1 Tax=Muraenolepis orangiensis TaxID=630683 RepID=A0A9Q0EMC8_9TELE|nr:hypothetical protein NHX12_021979 [Muraenolepis orangiensis]